MESVLLVVPAALDQDSLLKVKNHVGSTAVQVFENVAKASFEKASLNIIYSNVCSPSVSIHQPNMFARYLSALNAGGRLILEETVLLTDLPSNFCPITRKASDLESMLKLAGFIEIQSSIVPVSDEILTAYFGLWGTTKIEQGISRLSGKFGIVHIEAKKPAYEVGQKVSLNLGKKAVWTAVSMDDLEDEDALLDESDRVKPSQDSLSKPSDCELTDGKKKACKNCTCGLAEEQNDASLDLIEDEIVQVDPTPKKTGGCGSCALGDAFRCSTCPYLGMPAFNTGDKIGLGGMFAQDDID